MLTVLHLTAVIDSILLCVGCCVDPSVYNAAYVCTLLHVSVQFVGYNTVHL